ncbi:MAG TPA: metallopeptidase family protein [Polyangia bacterium]|jgi:predicted Zn-dependent protease with MMP-like domain
MARPPEDDITQQADDSIIRAAWDAFDAGKLETARRRAERLGERSPEGLYLRAACCREEDDAPGAIHLLRQAIAADPEWASPELAFAELLAEGPDTLAEARKHAARAVELAEEEEEFLSALALKAGLEAEAGDIDDARRTLAELPPPDVVLGDPDAALEIADLHLALGDAELARGRLRTLTSVVPDSAEVWHALGCAAADLEDDAEMRAAWKRTWALDAAPGAAGGARQRLTDEEVGAIAEQALGELPARARELLRDVPIVIADQPAESDVDAGVDPRSLGLFNGTPYPDASHLGGQPGLTQILIFRRNLERMAGSDDELREEIRTTLLHETGHFFGMSDDDLEGVGLG